MAQTALYPAIEAYESGMLPLDDLHTMAWDQAGNPDGMPVVYVHGGPGAPTSPDVRRLFDPDHYRIVLFHQRGVGRSTPRAEIKHNTTWHLVADMERLREHLQIERWHVAGGSWGSTLSLAYAQSHPKSCISLMLRGIFLCRDLDIDWFLHGMGRFFPESERDFLAAIPEAERSDLLGAYHRRLLDPDPAIHNAAAHAWSRYEGSCVTLLPNPGLVDDFGGEAKALSLARLECHYFVNGGWLEPNQLLRDVDRLRAIPGAIVQGRYDVVCPPSGADALARAWPEARYLVVSDAGHAVSEPGIARALVEVADAYRSLR
ncbi:MAG: prolyl aminopeptidase [Pseudomonadota bacterium]